MSFSSNLTHMKPRVLVVDDDPFTVELLENALWQFGYEVETATNGAEAIERYRKFGPRFLVSDVEMPEMSGVELCRAIRKRASCQYTYVILLTSHSDPDAVDEGLNAGADDYICKPFRPEELRLRLESGKRLLQLEGRDMMIFSLAKLAESRSEETGLHLERIREYCRILSLDLMTQPKFEHVVDAQFVELIYQTSPLHDIGKVGTPDAILMKPGKLTAEEFEIMKRHTIIGGDTLRASVEAYPEAKFLMMALDIALKHHERWDGSGYPFGLRGGEIPLAARIVAVADVYDALTSKRSYKEAQNHEMACDIIRQGRGSHFDPSLVESFNRCELDFKEVSERFSIHPKSAIPAPALLEERPEPSLSIVD